ncbi:MAG: cyclic nucleotide-binding domain-containing protein, partial [bacterium]
LNENELQKVCAIAEERRLEKDEMLFDEGSAGTELYVIKEGTIGIFKKVAGGRRRHLADLQKGVMFGELVLFDNNPRSAMAQASMPSSLVAINIDKFNCILSSDTSIAAKFQRQIILILCSRLRNTNEKLNQGVIWGFKTSNE